jgi:hypothetical protein
MTNEQFQYLIWPSVENMNANPEWMMPSMGKDDVTPYDILIDLIPWYVVRSLYWRTRTHQCFLGPSYASYCINIQENILSAISWA